MFTIFKKELKDFFITSSGYIVLSVFTLLSGLVFYVNNVITLSSDLGAFFSMMSYVIMLISPVIAMKAFANEYKQGTDVILKTYPISNYEVVLGKFFSMIALVKIALMLSLVYPLIVAIWGQIYLPELIVGYLGVFLQASAYIAIDLLLASFARHSGSTFVMLMGSNILIRLAGLLTSAVNIRVVKVVLSFIDLQNRFISFSYGLLSPVNIIYYVMFVIVCLFSASLTLSIKRLK